MALGRTGSAAFVACVVLPFLGGCPAAPAPPPAACGSDAYGSEASLLLDRGRLRANGATPALLAKLDSSAHRYARLLAMETAARVCFAFRDVRWHLPVVAIHGDAHVEQFVITPKTFGLEDFDQAGFGPAVVDLVRFASSLHLACRETKWQCRPDDAVAAFFGRIARRWIMSPSERCRRSSSACAAAFRTTPRRGSCGPTRSRSRFRRRRSRPPRSAGPTSSSCSPTRRPIARERSTTSFASAACAWGLAVRSRPSCCFACAARRMLRPTT